MLIIDEQEFTSEIAEMKVSRKGLSKAADSFFESVNFPPDKQAIQYFRTFDYKSLASESKIDFNIKNIQNSMNYYKENPIFCEYYILFHGTIIIFQQESIKKKEITILLSILISLRVSSETITGLHLQLVNSLFYLLLYTYQHLFIDDSQQIIDLLLTFIAGSRTIGNDFILYFKVIQNHIALSAKNKISYDNLFKIADSAEKNLYIPIFEYVMIELSNGSKEINYTYTDLLIKLFSKYPESNMFKNAIGNMPDFIIKSMSGSNIINLVDFTNLPQSSTFSSLQRQSTIPTATTFTETYYFVSEDIHHYSIIPLDQLYNHSFTPIIDLLAKYLIFLSDDKYEEFVQNLFMPTFEFSVGLCDYTAFLLDLFIKIKKLPFNFFTSSIFSDRLTDNIQNFDVIHSLRFHCIYQFIINPKLDLNTFMKCFELFPTTLKDIIASLEQIIPELFTRIEKQQIHSDIASNIESFLHLLIERSNSMVCFDGIGELCKMANIFRRELFNLIHLINVKGYLLKLMSNSSNLADDLCHMIMEPPLINYILDELQILFKQSREIISSLLTAFDTRIKVLLYFMQKSPMQQEIMSIATNFSIELLRDHPELADYFYQFFSTILDDLHDISKNKNSLIEKLLKLFTLLNPLSHNTKNFITDKQVKKLSQWINNVYGFNPSLEIATVIKECLYRYDALTPRKEFFNPKFITLIFAVFKYSSAFVNIINEINTDCLEDALNCVICNRYEIDLDILQIIESTKIDPTISIKEDSPIDENANLIDPKAIDALFLLFETISFRSSSIVTAMRFVSLFCPISNAYLPSYYNRALRCFENILERISHQPCVALPYTENSEITFMNIHEFLLVSGFKAAVWLLPMCYTTNLVQIFKITLSSNKSIKISIRYDLISISYDQKTENKSTNMKINSWDFITFSIQAQPQSNPASIQILVRINENNAAFIEIPQLPLNKEGKMRLTFGENKTCEQYYIGPISICLPNTDLSEYYKDGPRSLSSYKAKFLMYANPALSSNYLMIGESFDIKYKSFIVHTIQSLPGIIASHGNAQSLIPLLAQCNLEDQHGNKVADSFMRSMQIILRILSLNLQAQVMFDNGFSIIAFFIQQFPVYISTNLYDLFINMLSKLTYKKTIEDLILIILTNPSLWMGSNPEVVHHVTQSWAEQLAITNPREFGSIRKFWWFATFLKLYCYPISTESTAERSRYDLNIVRQNLLKAFLRISKETNLDSKDFEILTHEIISCNDNMIRKQLLQFTYDLLVRIKNSYADAMQPLLLLRFLLLETDNDIVMLIFMIIGEISNSQKITTFNYYTIVLREIERDFQPSKELFTKLTEMCRTKLPSLLTVLCWMALQLQQDEIYDIILDFEPSSKFFVENMIWYEWPVLMLFNLPRQEQKIKLLKFLLLSSPDGWNTIMNTIISISLILEYNMREMQRLMLTTIAEIIPTLPKYSELFEALIIRYFFYTINESSKSMNNSLSPSLQTIYSKSSFSVNFTTNNARKLSKGDIGIRSLSQSLENMSEMIRSTIKIPLSKISTFQLSSVSYVDIDCTVRDFIQNFTVRLFSDIAIEENGNWNDFDFFVKMKDYLTKHRKAIDYIYKTYQSNAFPSIVLSSEMNRKSYIENFNEINIFFQEIYQNLPAFLDEITSFIEILADDQKNATKLTEHLSVNNILSNDFHLIAEQLLMRFNSEESNNLLSQKALWAKLWHELTMNRAPWFMSLPASQRTAYYKRDNCLCKGYPAKVKRNYHFDIHKMASEMRNTGNVSTAMKKVKEAELAEQIGLKEKSELLTIQPEHNNENNSIIKYPNRLECILVTVAHTTVASFNYNNFEFCIQRENKGAHIIPFKDVESVFWRTVFHKLTALEIFVKNGDSYFVNFPNSPSITILKDLKKKIPTAAVQTSDFQSFFESSGATNKWIKRQLTNFEYLLEINKYSGRSFNHVSQYPIFPWVIDDYKSDILDLNNPKSFRPLSKPMGAMDEKRLKELRAKYDDLKNDNSDLLMLMPYLYNNGPMAYQTLYVYMVRMEPFTKLHIDHQSGRFDTPDRQFKSISMHYKLNIVDNNSYSELIPEFYFLPDFLSNSNNFDLGISDGKDISEVELPPWANNSPFLFVYKMRKALESDYVSEHINEWIDLTFGVKQESIEANNVYLKALYANVWDLPNITNEEQFISEQTTTCGQIPRKIFSSLHPKRQQKSFKYTLPYKSSFKIPSGIDDKIITGSIIEELNLEFGFAFITTDGRVCIMKLPTSIIDEKEREKRGLQQRIRSSDSCYNFDPLMKAVSNSCLYIVDKNKREIYEISLDAKVTKFAISQSDILCISSSQHYIITGDSEGVATVYDTVSRSIYTTVDMFRAGITSIDISEEFMIFVCWMLDGTMIVSNLNSKNTVRTISLKEIYPDITESDIINGRVLITYGWGLIVIFFGQENERRVCVFTTNSAAPVVSSITMNKHMIFESNAITFTDSKGFDYILQTHGKSVLDYEVAELNQSNLLFAEAPERILALYYSKKLNVIVSITSGGIMFTGYSPQEN